MRNNKEYPVYVVKKSTLPTVSMDGEVLARIFDGSKNGGWKASAFIVDLPTGTGPGLHKHPYEEIFFVLQGTVRVESNGESVDATPEEICIAPANSVHKFTNIGPGRAVLVNVHASPEVVTEFVTEGPGGSSEYSDGANYHIRHD